MHLHLARRICFWWIGFAVASVASAQIYVSRVATARLDSASTVSPGDVVRVSFTTAAGVSPAEQVSFEFTSPGGTRTPFTLDAASGVATANVTAAWANGTYRLAAIRVQDARERVFRYDENGLLNEPQTSFSTHLQPAPGAWPDFETLTFTVTGAGGTVAAPVLTSATRTSAAVLTAGSPITYDLTATAGAHPITRIEVALRSPDGVTVRVPLHNAPSGTATLATGPDWSNGTYTIQRITVLDAESVTLLPRGDASGLVPDTLGFELTGGAAPGGFPQITGLRRVGSGPVTPSVPFQLEYTLVPGPSPIASVTFRYSSGMES